MPVSLRGLLLDSGDTLARPRGGRWNPRFDFEEVVARHLPDLDPERFPEAFVAGDRYLLDWDRMAAEAGYRSARAGYHRAILGASGSKGRPMS